MIFLGKVNTHNSQAVSVNTLEGNAFSIHCPFSNIGHCTYLLSYLIFSDIEKDGYSDSQPGAEGREWADFAQES